MINFRISETDEYEKLVPFFIENELEFTEEDMEEVPTDVVKCWEIVDKTDGNDKLIGGFVLAKREGEYICDGIAIAPAWRGTRLGKALLDKGIEEVQKQGGSRMYLVARAPEFFRKSGFETVGRDEAPNFFECLSCPQYQVSCHPEVMRLDI
ncbi:MAG: GNAT family N-acetyltransferase [Bacillota bacterium]|nr:GNAT family N-acetyltransferase [Bacillota bacterium]